MQQIYDFTHKNNIFENPCDKSVINNLLKPKLVSDILGKISWIKVFGNWYLLIYTKT